MSNNNSIKIFNIQKSTNCKELIIYTIRRWYIIIGASLLAALIAFIYSSVFLTPKYSSTAKIIVFNKEQSTTTNDMELSSSLYLAKDFKEIIQDKIILGDVVKKLNNKYSIGQIRSFLTINNPTSTRIIEITALSPNAKDSKLIVDSICEIAQNNLVELMGLDRITPISDGDVAAAPSSPNIGRNTWFGAFIGILIGFLSIFIMCSVDNKISTPEDIEKLLDLSVLATIPYNNSKQKNRK